MNNSDTISFSTKSSELKNDIKADGSDNGEESNNKPDDDTIKMFVGQIPKVYFKKMYKIVINSFHFRVGMNQN